MSKIPFSLIAEIQPSRGTMRLNSEDAVTFIPMEDVSENGQWIGHRMRPFGEVRSGFTCFKENDILVAKITPCMENGKGCIAVGLRNGIGFGSTEFHVLRAIGRNDPRFIYHWTQAREMRREAKNYMIGSAGQQRVHADFFRRFEIEEIAPTEQRRIAEILDTADEAIQKTEGLIAKLKQMKAGLLHDLLTRGIDENGELRPKFAVSPTLYNESELGPIPKEWQIARIREIVPRVVVGHVGETSSGYCETGVPFFRTQNVRRMSLQLQDLKMITPMFHAVLRKSQLNAGDVLVSRVGANRGMAAVVPKEFDQSNCANIIVISPGSRFDPYFLALLVNSSMGQSSLLGVSVGSAQGVINTTDIKRWKSVVPPREEQERIVGNVVDSESRIAVERAILEKYRLLKTGLMHDLLTGKKLVRKPSVTNLES